MRQRICLVMGILLLLVQGALAQTGPTIHPIATANLTEDQSKIHPIYVTDPDDPASNLGVVLQSSDSDHVLLSVYEQTDNDTIWIGIDPSAGWSGSVTGTVRVFDGLPSRSVDLETFTINVAFAADYPVLVQAFDSLLLAEDDCFTLDADTLVTHFYDDDIPYGDSFSITDITYNHGSVSQAGSVWTLCNAENYYGFAAASLTLQDTNYDTLVVFNLPIRITPVNDAPEQILACDPLAMTEDVIATVNGNALKTHFTDPDGDEFEVDSLQFNHGTVTRSGATYSLHPTENYAGAAEVTVYVSESVNPDDLGTTATISVDIAPVNDAPVVGAIADQTASEDTPLTVAFTASDPEDDTMYFAVATDQADVSASVNGAARQITLTPTNNWNGTTTVTLTVSDSELRLSTEVNFDLVVSATNDAPVADPGLADQSIDEDASFLLTEVAILAAFTDPEGDDLSVDEVSSSAGTVTPEGDDYRITPAADFFGDLTITVTVIETITADAYSTSDSFTLTVNAVNDAPVIDAIADQSTDEDVQLRVAYSVNDVDNASLELSVSSDEANVLATLDELAEEIVLTPAADWNGTATITLTANDAALRLTDGEQFTLTVDAVNDAPYLVEAYDDIEALEDTPFELTDAELLANFDDVDGDVLLVQSVSFDHGSVVHAAGTATFTPDEGYNGWAEIGITAVEDGTVDSFTASATIDVAIGAVNDSPDIDPIADQNMDEDDVLRVAYAGTDPEADPISWSVASSNVNLVAVLDEVEEEIVLTPAADWNGSATITLTADDGVVRTTSQESFLVTVNAINDAPYLNSALDDRSTDEDVALSLTNAVLVAHFDDVDGDALTISNVEWAEGSVVTQPGGWLLTPAADYNGSSMVTITARESATADLYTAQGTFTLTVDAINDAPVITLPGDQSTDEDVELRVAYLISDVDNAEFTLDISSSADEVSASIDTDNGELVLVPDADWSGTSNITFTASDEVLRLSDSETFTLTVNAVNDAPVVATPLEDQSIDEDEEYAVATATLLAAFSDVENDVLSIQGVAVDEGAASLFEGVWTITPEADWSGIITVTVTAREASTAEHYTVQDVFELTVNAVNDAPVIAAIEDQTLAEDGNLQVAYSVSDIDGGELLLSVSTGNAFLTVELDLDNEEILLAPVANWFGNSLVTLEANDQVARTISSTSFMVTVTPVNDVPTLATPFEDREEVEDTPFTLLSADLVAAFEDVEDDALVVNQVSFDQGTVVSVAGGYQLTPTSEYSGAALITVEVREQNSVEHYTAQTTINVDIAPENDAPVIASIDTQTMDEDGTLAVPYVVSDVDNPELTLSVTSNNDSILVSLDEDAEEILISLVADFNGSGTVTLRADDEELRLVDTEDFAVIVSAVNDEPVVAGVHATVNAVEDTDFVLSTSELLSHLSDIDGDELTVDAIDFDHGVVSQDGDNWTFTPAADYFGSAEISLTAIEVGTVEAYTVDTTVPVEISAANDAPVIVALDDQELDEDSTLSVAYFVSDVDNGSLSLSVSSDDENLDVELDELAGEILLTPAENWNGSALVTLTADDEVLRATDSETFTVTVTPVNDAPYLSEAYDNVDATESTPFELTAAELLANFADVENDELAVDSLAFNHGTFSLDGDTYTFTPTTGYNGWALIYVRAAETATAEAYTVDASIDVAIGAVNDPPEITAIDDQEMDEDTVLRVAYSGTDPESDPITWSVSADEEQVSVELDEAESEIVLTPSADWNGSALITLVASDGIERITASETFTLTVLPVNDQPVLESALADRETAEDTPLTLTNATLLASFSDVDEDELAVSLVEWAEGTVAAQAGGWLLTPVANYNGSALVTVTVAETGTADLFSVQGTFTLAVSAVNDAPFVTQELDTLLLGRYSSNSSIDLDDVFDDLDNETLSYSVSGDTDLVDVSIDGEGVVTISSNDDWLGDAVLVFTAEDEGSRLSASEDLVVSVIQANAWVSGQVRYYTDENNMEDVLLTLTGTDSLSSTTDADGEWQILVETIGDYSLRAEQVDEVPSGVSVVDCIKIRRHLAELEVFDDPYQLVAGDVNASGTVNVSDVIAIRRALADLDPLPTGEWKFFAAGYAIDMANWPLAPTTYDYEPLSADLTGQDFLGVCMGDVDGSWNAGELLARGGETTCLSSGVIQRESTDLVRVPLVLDADVELAGAQFQLSWPAELELNDVSSSLAVNWTSNQTEQRLIMVFEQLEGVPLRAGQPLAELIFRVPAGDTRWALELENVVLASPAGEALLLGIVQPVLDMSRIAQLPTELALHDCWPNPFNPVTNLSFDLPKATLVNLAIYDLLGRQVAVLLQGEVVAGSHVLQVDASAWASGTYFAVLRTGDSVKTSRLLLIK